MSGEQGNDYGSTTGEPTPGPSSSDEPNADDAMAHVDVSTEHLAHKEREESARSDSDSASQSDRKEEGRWHSRSQGDRDETGKA